VASIQAQMSRVVESLGLTEQEALRRSQTLADLVLAEWRSIAGPRLNKTRQAYLNSLQVRQVTANGFICGLPAAPSTSILAHMVEQGMGSGGVGTQGSYDVRTYLLRASTRNIRTAKDGSLYLNVPFSHSPKSIEAMGGKQARAAAQRLKATTTGPQGTRWGGRLGAGKAPKLKPHHVSDPLAGMVRLASTYSRKQGGGAVTQTGGYRTWRRASFKNKRPQAWISRGIVARHFMDQVVQRFPDLFSMVY